MLPVTAPLGCQRGPWIQGDLAYSPLSLPTANCQELVNLQSRVLALTAHLRRKCQCGTGGTECSRAATAPGQTPREAALGTKRVVWELQAIPKNKGEANLLPCRPQHVLFIA